MEILKFERQWPVAGGRKDQAIRDTFGVRPVRYYQRLNKVIDDPTVVMADPELARRLRERRDDRTHSGHIRTHAL